MAESDRYGFTVPYGYCRTRPGKRGFWQHMPCDKTQRGCPDLQGIDSSLLNVGIYTLAGKKHFLNAIPFFIHVSDEGCENVRISFCPFRNPCADGEVPYIDPFVNERVM